jgi:hypothetical protein
MKTVEDCIEILAGIQQHDAKFQLAREDYNLITSLARQTFRGTGYTDRQCELAKEKVLNYRQQFENNKLDIDIALTSTRLPLREIDRSRWIKIVEQPSDVIYSSDHIGPWLAVRFIFQKKLITAIESIKRSIGDGVYDKKEKVHYFPFNERTVFALVDAFNETNSFVIEDTVKDYYEKLQEMKNNKHKYIPGIYGLKLKNLHNKSFDYAISSIGEPSIENLCHYYDQKDRLGLFHFDDIDLQESLKSLTPLSKKVIQRNKNQICLSPKEYTVNHLAEVVLELYRFPLVIVLDEKDCYSQLVQFHKAFNGIIPSESCSVMFRLDNDISEGKEFNQYIKQHNLNNLVDKNTKIVYISNNKVPKPLLKSEWFPITAITTSSNRSYGAKTDSYIDMLDLVIHYDDDVSTWKRNKIEKL